MKLYDSIGPNPRVVKMFMAEQGIDLPRQPIAPMKGDDRQESYGRSIRTAPPGSSA